LWQYGWFRSLRERFWGWEPQVTPAELQSRFGLSEVARWQRRGQWIAIFARLERVDPPPPRSSIRA
jgi:hypothetical protein